MFANTLRKDAISIMATNSVEHDKKRSLAFGLVSPPAIRSYRVGRQCSQIDGNLVLILILCKVWLISRKSLPAWRITPKGLSSLIYAKCANTILENPDKAAIAIVFIELWAGEPYVNIQPKRGMGKPYQVKQVLAAIKKKESM